MGRLLKVLVRAYRRKVRIWAGTLVAMLGAQSVLLAAPAWADADVTSPSIVEISPTTGTTFGREKVTFVVRAYDEHPGQMVLTFGEEDDVIPAPPPDLPEPDEQTNMNATLTVNTESLADGPYALHVKAIDEAGNTTERMARYVVDKVAPSVPIGGAPHGTIVPVGNVVFGWSEASDTTSPEGIHYELRASQNSSEVGATPDGTGALYIDRIASPSYQATNWRAGTWYWQVRAVDPAGNKSAWSEVWHMMLDDSVPTIEVVEPNEGILLGADKALTVKASVFDANGLREYGVLLDGTEVQKVVNPPNGAMDAISINTSSVNEGTHAVTIFAVDAAGLRSEVSRIFELDVTAPAITTPLEDSQTIKGAVQLTMESADVHPGAYTVSITDEHGAIIEEGAPTVAADATLQYGWDTSRVMDGTYGIRFRAIDAAGNETLLTRTVRVKNETSIGSGVSLPIVPLVKALDVELTQPRLLGIVTPPVGGEDISEDVSAKNTKMQDMGIRTPETIPIQPTESGWRLFGVLWYWWVLFAGGAGVTGWWTRRLFQRRTQELV